MHKSQKQVIQATDFCMVTPYAFWSSPQNSLHVNPLDPIIFQTAHYIFELAEDACRNARSPPPSLPPSVNYHIFNTHTKIPSIVTLFRTVPNISEQDVSSDTVNGIVIQSSVPVIIIQTSQWWDISITYINSAGLIPSAVTRVRGVLTTVTQRYGEQKKNT